MGDFKDIGEFGVALILWAIIIWLFSKPKRLLIVLIILFTIIYSVITIADDTNETFYVNTNTLELLDKPFGTTKVKLKMNDSLVLISRMSDDWMKVTVGVDTLYFKNNFYYNSKLGGYTYKIQETRFTKWKALKGEKVILNHPDGYIDINGCMMKNGDIVTVTGYSEYDKEIELEFKNAKGYSTKIPIKYFTINWEEILKKYPNLQ